VQVRSLDSAPRRTHYWAPRPTSPASCGWQKLCIWGFCICVTSHTISTSLLLCCPLILCSHRPRHIILSCLLSHLITQHQRWRASRVSSRRNVFPTHSFPTLIYTSPILVSFVIQVGRHPDRPLFPSAFPSVFSNRFTVAEYFILATHQPTPSFFPFFLRLSAFVFSEIPFSQYRTIIVLTLFCNRVW
jgi:hypothetical protein